MRNDESRAMRRLQKEKSKLSFVDAYCLNKYVFSVLLFCWQTQFTAFVASVAKILTYAI